MCLDDGEKCKYEIASNRENGMEYQVKYFPASDIQAVLVKGYSKEKVFEMEPNDYGVFEISTKLPESQDVLRVIKIEY